MFSIVPGIFLPSNFHRVSLSIIPTNNFYCVKDYELLIS